MPLCDPEGLTRSNRLLEVRGLIDISFKFKFKLASIDACSSPSSGSERLCSTAFFAAAASMNSLAAFPGKQFRVLGHSPKSESLETCRPAASVTASQHAGLHALYLSCLPSPRCVTCIYVQYCRIWVQHMTTEAGPVPMAVKRAEGVSVQGVLSCKGCYRARGVIGTVKAMSPTFYMSFGHVGPCDGNRSRRSMRSRRRLKQVKIVSRSTAPLTWVFKACIYEPGSVVQVCE